MTIEHRSFFFATLMVALACSSDSDHGSSSDPAGEAREDERDDRRGSSARSDAGPHAPGGDPEKRADASAPSIGKNDDDDEENICDGLDIQARPNAPHILIVLDRSGSMLGINAQGEMVTAERWMPSARAVKSVTAELNEVVNFGLMLFPAAAVTSAPGLGDAGVTGGIDIPGVGVVPIPGLPPGTQIPGLTDPCATGRVDVPVAAMTASRIASAIDMGAPVRGNATPTAASLDAALAALQRESGACADCSAAKQFVLLVTDGQPTCGQGGAGTSTPADVMATNAAIDRLAGANVKTYVVGYGTRGDPMLAATMDSFAMHGGTERHLAVENETELAEELRAIAGTLVSCEYELNEPVEDPALVRVIIDDQELVLGEGWTLDGKRVVLGDGADGACSRIKDGRVHLVKIRKECEPMIFQ